LSKTVIVVGAGIAGSNAAVAAKRTDPEAEVILITQERLAAYSRCGIPLVIAREVNDFNNLITVTPQQFEWMEIDLLTKTKVTKIDPNKRTVTSIRNGSHQEELKYDSLILATGANSIIPPIRGVEKKGVYTVRTIEDGREICKAAETAEKAVIIGGGMIGLQIADAFLKRKLNVTIIELTSQVLRQILDEDMAEILHNRIRDVGINLISEVNVESILGDAEVKAVSVKGKQIAADIVILSIGAHANTELAVKAGAQKGSTEAIKVNERMETTVKGIYAAGDCVECKHLVTRLPILSQLGSIAFRQGKVAGINAVGGEASFPGTLSSAVSRFFGLEVGFTGLTEWQAKEVGIQPIAGFASGKSKAEYYPGSRDIECKLLFEPKQLRIIGGQIIGDEDVAQRINLIALAISKQATAFDLINLDNCYAPSLANALEPIASAAEIALKTRKA
jgi:NADH oxidase (H2O2-forming)